MKTSMFGWMVRANSSNTRCWYCISVPNFAAWNRRSPFHSRAARAAGVAGMAATGVSSHSFRKSRSLGREDHVLGVLDEPVVLGVEDVVDGGQADVLVDAAVAGDVVGVEQLVVVLAGCRRGRRRRRRRRPSAARRSGHCAARRCGRCRRGRRGRCARRRPGRWAHPGCPRPARRRPFRPGRRAPPSPPAGSRSGPGRKLP